MELHGMELHGMELHGLGYSLTTMQTPQTHLSFVFFIFYFFFGKQTWTFELATKTWSQMAVVKNIEKEWVPPGRWMHSAVTINKGTNDGGSFSFEGGWHGSDF